MNGPGDGAGKMQLTSPFAGSTHALPSATNATVAPQRRFQTGIPWRSGRPSASPCRASPDVDGEVDVEPGVPADGEVDDGVPVQAARTTMCWPPAVRSRRAIPLLPKQQAYREVPCEMLDPKRRGDHDEHRHVEGRHPDRVRPVGRGTRDHPGGRRSPTPSDRPQHSTTGRAPGAELHRGTTTTAGAEATAATRPRTWSSARSKTSTP